MWKTEPTRVVTWTLTVVLLCLPHLAVFGVPLTPEQIAALQEVLPALLMLIGGEVVRTQVAPAWKVPPKP